MSEKIDLSRAEVVPALPGYWRDPEAYQLPPGIVGGTVVRFGTLPPARDWAEYVEGGGLVIDYRDATSGESRRVIFSLSDQGLFVEFTGSPVAVPSQGDNR